MSEQQNDPQSEQLIPAPYVYCPVDAGATHEREILIAVISRDPYGRGGESTPSADDTTAPTTAPISPASGPESNTVPSTAEGEEH